MTPIRILPPCLLLALLTACGSTRHVSLDPIEPRRMIDSRLEVQPASRGLEPPSFLAANAQEEAGESAEGRFLWVRARLFSLEPDLVEEALGAAGAGLVAMVTSREEEGRLLAQLEPLEGDVEGLQELSLTLRDGQEGYLSILDQTAFVSGYTVKSSGYIAMADPEVAVALDGVLLTMRGNLDEGGDHVDLDLSLDVCELEEPFAKREVQLGNGSLTIQDPTGISRRMSTRVQLGRGEGLVFGGRNLRLDESGRALLVFVEAEQLDSPPEE